MNTRQCSLTQKPCIFLNWRGPGQSHCPLHPRPVYDWQYMSTISSSVPTHLLSLSLSWHLFLCPHALPKWLHLLVKCKALDGKAEGEDKWLENIFFFIVAVEAECKPIQTDDTEQNMKKMVNKSCFSMQYITIFGVALSTEHGCNWQSTASLSLSCALSRLCSLSLSA